MTRYVIFEACAKIAYPGKKQNNLKKVKYKTRSGGGEEKDLASWLAGFLFAQNVFSLAHLQGSMIVEPLHLNLDVIDPSQSYQVLLL